MRLTIKVGGKKGKEIQCTCTCTYILLLSHCICINNYVCNPSTVYVIVLEPEFYIEQYIHVRVHV